MFCNVKTNWNGSVSIDHLEWISQYWPTGMDQSVFLAKSVSITMPSSVILSYCNTFSVTQLYLNVFTCKVFTRHIKSTSPFFPQECPKCHVTIEKDGGCNHMICKNQNCKADFCWVCLGPWEPHGSSWWV